MRTLFAILVLLMPQNLIEENARLKRELEEAQRKLELQGQYTADATRTLNELQDHLSRISILEGQISGGTEGGQPLTKSRREKMLAAVRQMQTEVEGQAKIIAGFRSRERNYSVKVAELGAAITRFEGVIATKNQEIAKLRAQLDVVTGQVEKLREDQKITQGELVRKEQALQDERSRVQSLEREARTAAFVIGPIGLLVRQGIVVERRLLRSRVWKVSPTLNPAKLRAVDIAELHAMSIVAPRRKIEIISPHPPDSYTLVPESPTQCLFTITDPERFWTTKYLVVGIR